MITINIKFFNSAQFFICIHQHNRTRDKQRLLDFNVQPQDFQWLHLVTLMKKKKKKSASATGCRWTWSNIPSSSTLLAGRKRTTPGGVDLVPR